MGDGTSNMESEESLLFEFNNLYLKRDEIFSF